MTLTDQTTALAADPTGGPPILGALAKLETLLDRSIEAMTSRAPIDDRAHAEEKGRALLTLSRLPAERLREPHARQAAEAAGRIREKLAAESALLKSRLEASRLVADLIGKAIVASDWDGTYQPPLVPKAPLLAQAGETAP